MLKDFSPQGLLMGLLVAFVGFSSTFAVVLQGLKAVGASNMEASSGLMAVSISMGLCGILLSLWKRMPITIAWSTPGAAMLASSAAVPGGFSAAIGAFILTGILIIAAGLFKPLSRAVSSIPAALANAMLAGVMVGLCFAPVKAIALNPAFGLPIVLAFFVVGAFKRLLAIPAALLAFVVVVAFGIDIPEGTAGHLLSSLQAPIVFVSPVFNVAAAVSIALPLFIVTMASQNIPGIAILRINNYHPDPGPLFTATGIFTVLGAPFGAHAVNLAAITAAMCASEDAHPDPKRRYWAAVIAGMFYVVFGLLASGMTAFVALAPPVLIEAVAGLALIGAFSGSAMAAFKETESREAAAVTFIVTASGVSFFGISGAFWGLIAGGVVLALVRIAERLRDQA